MTTNPGVRETNPLPTGYHNEQWVATLDWADPDLAYIERLRLISDPGFPMWDVSYCFGRNKAGQKVKVSLPFDQIPKKNNIRGFIIEEAKRAGVYAKDLGILDNISTLQ